MSCSAARVVHRRQVLVDPAVDADLVASARKDRRDHLRMQQMADCRNEERRRQLVLVEQPRECAAGRRWRRIRRAKSTPKSDRRCARLALALSTSKLRPTATRAPLGHAAGLRRLPALTWNICASICESGNRTPGCGRDCASSPADPASRVIATKTRKHEKLFVRTWFVSCFRVFVADPSVRECYASRTPCFFTRKYTATTTSSTPLMPMTIGAPMKVAT